MRNGAGGVVIVREQRKPDALDVRELIASAVDGFCEEFALSGIDARRWLLGAISAESREMKAEL